MTLSGTLPMTRRCFFAAGLSATAAAAAGGTGEADAETDHLPKATLLFSGEGAKTYLLVFRTGQKVMKGLPAFARKHGLVAGYLTGIGAVRGAVLGYFEPEKKMYRRVRLRQQAEVLSLTATSLSTTTSRSFTSTRPSAARTARPTAATCSRRRFAPRWSWC